MTKVHKRVARECPLAKVRHRSPRLRHHRSLSPWAVVVVVACFALGTAGADGPNLRTATRPNVILIMADDIGYECFGCYGSKQYHTPRIDRLAREGMRFTSFHAQPLCTPTRVKLMTGLSNVRNYSAFSILPRDQKTIGEYFQEAGYRTAVGGKWQLLGAEHYKAPFRGKGTWPREAGFDTTCLWQVDRLGSRYWKPLLYVNGRNRQFGERQYGPDLVADSLLEFIRANRDQPFFVYYPMILVHNPFESPPPNPSRNKTTAQQRFEAMVTHMDSIVGRLVDEVDRLGLRDRTLIMFLGDNGTNKAIRSKLGDRIIRGGKGLTTDAGTHVACVARWPNSVPANTVCHDLADVSDILPTLAELCGLRVPKRLDGKSFAPQLRGRTGTPRDWLFCYYNPRPERTQPQRFAWDHDFKLYADGRFYDLRQDIGERHPLPQGEHDDRASKAHAKLQAVLESFPAEGQMLLKFPRARPSSTKP